MTRNNKEAGIKGENFFISQLNRLGILYEFVDDWYDFEVLGQKVEVKSCRLTHKFSNKHRKNQTYKIGRFDFTCEETRDLIHKENIWICFLVRHRDQFIMLGFCRGRKLKKKRYVSIHKTREFDLIDFDEWISMHNG